jgi:MerR family transcriptional regulator, light-induced transcriptional regulator
MSLLAEIEPAASADTARLRSGTAARLAGVPVATLRVWERRYGVVAAPKTATGQRLYSGHDVQRLRLIKQLTERGHAIGTIATLPLNALAQRAQAEAAAPPPAGARRLMVVGAVLAARLNSLPGRPPMVLHDDLDAAAAAVAADAADAAVVVKPVPPGLLLVHLPSLQPAAVRQLLALADRVGVRQVAVIYGFGTDALVQQLRSAGVHVRRDPVSADDLVRLMGGPPRALVPAAAALPGRPLPRRFSAKALAALAQTPSSVACECPRHLAEIVQHLTGFEQYSADCGARSPADEALHAQLNHVAGTARAMFEQALLGVMDAEGIAMPN